MHIHNHNSCYQLSTQFLAQTVIEEMYSHHIAALSTDPEDSGNHKSLRRLFKGPDVDIWNRGSANEFGRLLINGIEKNDLKMNA